MYRGDGKTYLVYMNIYNSCIHFVGRNSIESISRYIHFILYYRFQGFEHVEILILVFSRTCRTPHDKYKHVFYMINYMVVHEC